MDITTFSLAFNTMSSRRPVSVPYTSNTTVTFPAGVFQVDMTGYGARGADASSFRVQQYKRDVIIYGVRRSDGGTQVISTSLGEQTSGATPSFSYCDPPQPTSSSNQTFSSTRVCYSNFVDTSYTQATPATTGASATGISKTFPGSTGNVAQTPVGFTNVPVTAGTPYNLVIPSGGSITINYYA